MTGIEILDRESKIKKRLDFRGNLQLSINSWGHLVIRILPEEAHDANGNESLSHGDKLIILDKEATNMLYRFLTKAKPFFEV